ncbi:hypothetical protein A3836_10015 [Staphylococcus hominis]|uniref:hypothetical protein n=1 Tax=Staphylococcus hominis TaxID=1290 RepID=UPI0007D91934|nr:hypothetical protein [Staphylococcus hominis]OAO00241.1 hypothetical protein A3836_10015 [Staphylococcus hominis]
MAYDISNRIDKYTQSNEYKENTFHFGIYLVLTSLAGTIVFMFSNTAIWVTPLNMAVASFLILLIGTYKKKDKRDFLVFYLHGTQRLEIIKSIIFGVILFILELSLDKITYSAVQFFRVHLTSGNLRFFNEILLFIMNFFLTFLTLMTLTAAINFFVKPVALLIVKQVMKHRKDKLINE